MTITIEKEDFVAWLKKQAPDKVYNMNSCRKCMISAYLVEKHRRAVDTSVRLFSVGTESYFCPQWAHKFQETALHPRHRRAEDMMGVWMTVTEALEMLK